MFNPLLARWTRLSLAQKFNLASLLVLALSMLVLGWWVGKRIEVGVVQRTAATTALYVENFIITQLQELSENEWLSEDKAATLQELLATTPLGEEIVGIKIWGPGGRIVYGDDVGGVYPVKDEQALAWQGRVTSHISSLDDPENAEQRERWDRLIETYTPMRLEGTDRVIAVAEFYQTTDALEREIATAQRRSWWVVGLVTLITYLLLNGMVRRGSHTIERQQGELTEKVAHLNRLLIQNEELHERVRRAATRNTTLNERFLRRIGSELHDGPAQDVSLSLLRLDNLGGQVPDNLSFHKELDIIQSSLDHALDEIRTLAAGLRLPELNNLTLCETVNRVVRMHQKKMGTNVHVQLADLPEHPPLSVKITVFRVIQEALTNVFMHAGGKGQAVHLRKRGEQVLLEVSDQGPGFDVTALERDTERLGLLGMRERVESLGGVFRIASDYGKGTRVSAQIPLYPEDDLDDPGTTYDP